MTTDPTEATEAATQSDVLARISSLEARVSKADSELASAASIIFDLREQLSSAVTQLQKRYDGLDTRIDMAEKAMSRFGTDSGNASIGQRLASLVSALQQAPALHGVLKCGGDGCFQFCDPDATTPAPSTSVASGVVSEAAKG